MTATTSPSFMTGTTISDCDCEEQAIWPGNACTSATISVRASAQDVPQTPRLCLMLKQAKGALKRTELQFAVAHHIESHPKIIVESLLEQRRHIGKHAYGVVHSLHQSFHLQQDLSILLCHARGRLRFKSLLFFVFHHLAF